MVHTVSFFFPFCIIKLGLVEKWKGSSILQQRFLAGVGMVEKIANFPVCDTNGKKWTEERKSIGEKSSRVCTTHNSINYCVIAWRVSIMLTYSNLNSYFDFYVCLSIRPSVRFLKFHFLKFPFICEEIWKAQNFQNCLFLFKNTFYFRELTSKKNSSNSYQRY